MSEELVNAVRNMRRWQKEYFRTRHPRAMDEAKVWEKKVDAILDKIDNPGLF